MYIFTPPWPMVQYPQNHSKTMIWASGNAFIGSTSKFYAKPRPHCVHISDGDPIHARNIPLHGLVNSESTYSYGIVDSESTYTHGLVDSESTNTYWIVDSESTYTWDS